jgi:hypothetical protein
MKRKLFTIASAISLLLLLATVGLWVRSLRRSDSFSFWTASGLLELRTQKGKLTLDNEPQRALDQQPMEMVIKKRKSIDASIEPLERQLSEADSEWQRNLDRFNKGAAGGAAARAADLRMKLDEPERQRFAMRELGLRWALKPLAISPAISHSVPLYLPLILSAVLPAMSIVSALLVSRRTRHRQQMRECLTCGYNLHGNTSGVCPECGTPVAGNTEVRA